MASVASRESYFETGLDVLSDLGYGGLKLAEVCHRLGVTTGSFYHYFPSWPAYTKELVTHWMQQRTVWRSRRCAAKRIRAAASTVLIQVGLGLPHGAEAAIRVWSSLDPHVHAVQAAVDRQRYDIMYESAFEILKNERQAQVFAAWAVYLLVGYEQAALPPDPGALAWIAGQLRVALDSDGSPRCPTVTDPRRARPTNTPVATLPALLGVLVSASRPLRTDMASLWRRAVDRIRQRDPEFDALRRAARAAIVVPVAAGVGFAVGGGSQTPLFTIFGSVALLILVDFPGNRPARALAYAGLGLNGCVLITLGTLVAPHPWVSVAVMFVLGVVVTFSGCAQRDRRRRPARHPADLRAAGMHAGRPDRGAPARLAHRVGGVRTRGVVRPPAAPPRRPSSARRTACCSRLADALEGAAPAKEATRAMNALWENFLGADFRPVALTAGSRALVRVVDDLGLLVRPDHRRHRLACWAT